MSLRAARKKIWHVSNAFHYAGTDRAMETWCLGLDPRRFEVSAYSRMAGGPRLKKLKSRLSDAAVIGDWKELFRRRRCDLLHLHRHGEADSGWDALIAEARSAGTQVIVETNVFGAHDRTGLGSTLDHHFFVSAMCLWRYAGWPSDLEPGYFQKHSVLYNPLQLADFPKALRRLQARKQLGIPADAFVLGRLGRPDLNKWPVWFAGAFNKFARRHANAHLLLMQAPGEVLAGLDKGRFTQFEASGEWKQVAIAYQAMDCLAHGSRVGESFGYTLAEAQAFGLPVVVDSTPWADNAQIEIVNHGETGLIAGRPGAYLQALEALYIDPELRARMGAAGRKLAGQNFDSKKLVKALETSYDALLKAKEAPGQVWVRQFKPEYEARLARRVSPSALLDGLWSLWSACRLYWRTWASLGLKAAGLRR